MEDKQKVLPEDYQFLWRIVSLQHALINSSTSPVVLRNKEEGADFEMACFGGMYYDACEDEKKAIATMKKRIRLAEEDIEEHFKLHKSCLDSLLEMDGAIIIDNREIFADNCRGLCDSVLKYVELVSKHKDSLREESFLIYPCCFPGHYFYVLNNPFVRECSFNETEVENKAKIGINLITEQITDFKIRQEKLPYINPALDEQDWAGLFNRDFKEHLRTNKLLLERAGMKL